MSWNARLERGGYTLTVERHAEGGTYALGGTDRAEMSVTYNYTPLFSLAAEAAGQGPASEPLRSWLDGKRARDVQSALEAMRDTLPDWPDGADYWTPTTSNARRVLTTLCRWGAQHPDATWKTDG